MQILRKIYSIIIDLFETFVIAGGIFVVIYAFLFRPFQVNGQSMFPTFHDGEYILTNLVALHFDSLDQGDVIVFKSPTDKDKDFVKRIIGVPGDQVSIRNGRVYVNGQLLNESEYLSPDVRTFQGAFLNEGQTVVVPQNNYFVLGDNREYSSDSREWGFVSRDKVIGRSMVVYWPINKFQYIKGAEYEGQ